MNCIPKHIVNDFIARIKSGEITPEKLLEMDSAQRHGYFAQIFGVDNAKNINSLFEKKMLMKVQNEAITQWAKDVAGISPKIKRDLLSRVEKLDKLLTPKEESEFMADLVATRLNANVTMQEAANIVSLAKDVTKKLSVLNESTKDRSPEALEYGRAVVEFQDYYNGLKDETVRIPLKEYLKPSNYWGGLKNVAGFAKALKASFDNSVIGRQGFMTMWSHPDIWAKNSLRSFGDFWNSMTGKDAMKEIRADVLSRKNARNGLYKKEGLAVGVQEEAYPTSLPEKVPVLGKVFKGSQDAFTAWQYRTRADVFDRLVDVAERTGADIEGLGKVVNSLTGRGSLGKAEPIASTLNNFFFSPRYLKANFDVLTAHTFSKNVGSFARKEAAKNLLKAVMGTAAVLAIAKSINPDSVETDTRSSDFGKIKIGDTRFNITGGFSSLITLASRLVPAMWGKGATKSTTTGLITPLNSEKFGAKTGLDVLYKFFEGKASPAFSIVLSHLRGSNFQGQKPTIFTDLIDLFVPLPATNFNEIVSNPNAAPLVLAMISDELGFGTNTYSTDVDWATKNGLEMNQFHQKVGDVKFKEANTEYNKRYKEWYSRAKNSAEYKALTDDEKGQVLQKSANEIKQRIFKENHFSYKPTKKNLPKIK